MKKFFFDNRINSLFFLNDVWRFPLGNNPNDGTEVANSIVYSGSILDVAIFFKLNC